MISWVLYKNRIPEQNTLICEISTDPILSMLPEVAMINLFTGVEVDSTVNEYVEPLSVILIGWLVNYVIS